jgi:hypothetical protein
MRDDSGILPDSFAPSHVSFSYREDARPMRMATTCERCGAPVPESRVWVVQSGVRVYCATCGYLSAPEPSHAEETGTGVIVHLRRVANA